MGSSPQPDLRPEARDLLHDRPNLRLEHPKPATGDVKPKRDPHSAPRGPPCPNPEPRSDRAKFLQLARLVDLDQRTLLHRKAQQREGFRRATDADITAPHAPAQRRSQFLDARHVNTDARSGSDRDRGIGVGRLDRKVDFGRPDRRRHP